jgi:hypothetical protein
MAQTALTPIVPITAIGSVTAGALALPFTAADNVNGNSWGLGGRDLLLIYNSDAAAQTVTITSTPDTLGRTSDIAAYSIPAGAFAAIYVTSKLGWVQSDGTIHLTASTATVKFAVVRC